MVKKIKMIATKIVPIDPGSSGNTKQNSKQIAPAKRWCFTLNNYTDEDIAELRSIVLPLCKKMVVGKEVCPTTGTPHLQGWVVFHVKRRPLGLLTKAKPHWEKQSKKATDKENIEYCSKEDDVIIEHPLKKPIHIISELYDWQEEILDIFLGPVDDRKIYWFWEDEGNIGKSAFIKYMVVKHNVLFCSGGKYSDIMNLVFNQDMDNCTGIMFDIPRANRGCISYASLESMKNGMVCNTKYETGVKLFNCPHVMVFANFPPEDEDLDKLSGDRWCVKEL